MTAFPLRPLRPYVVLRRVRAPEASAGGILLPDYYKKRVTFASRRKDREPTTECGVVCAVWAGSVLAVDDKVIYTHRGDAWEWWDKGLVRYIVAEGDVLTLVEMV
jgi:co-chaperonin GroES (HSP10)